MLVVAGFFFLLSGATWAVPYFGQESFTYRQPDGETFSVRLYGDEFFAYQETEEGYLVIRDPDKGYFCYARVTDDGQKIVSTGVRVGQPKPPGLKPKQRLKPGEALEASREKRLEADVDERGRLQTELKQKLFPEISKEKESVESISPATADEEDMKIPSSRSSGAPLSGSSANAIIGERVGLVLLASFPDRPGDVTKTVAEIEEFCNAEEYALNGNAASVYQYFKIQSDGKLRYKNIVTAWFTAEHDRSYYTDPSAGRGVAAQLVREGLDALDAAGFDFGQCDADNNGVIDAVNLFYADTRVNSWGEALWPHKGSAFWDGFPRHGLSDTFQYQISDMPENLPVGTFIHESGHLICDFPDLYSYDPSAAANIGGYSHMGASRRTHPANMDPYLKIRAGWADVIDLDGTSHQRGAVQEDRNFFYRYRNPSRPGEYFLIETRGSTGYEGPFGGSTISVHPTEGLVVYHGYEAGSNTYSSIRTGDSPHADYSTPYELMVVEARPSSLTLPWYDDPAPGSDDAFDSSGIDALSDTSLPALKFWTSDGRTLASGLHIHSVSAVGSTMTFVAGSGMLSSPADTAVTATALEPESLFGSDAADQSFAVFNRGSGTVQYTISADAAWLTCTPSSGSVTDEADTIQVHYNTSGLAVGTYSATITVDGGSAGIAGIPVTLVVEQQPQLAGSTSSIMVEGIEGTAGPTAGFALENSGGGSCSYYLVPSDGWMRLSPDAGTLASEADTISVSLDATTLTAGTYSGTVTVLSDDATNSPLTIPVTYLVQSRDMLVTHPNGGESFQKGADIFIEWMATIGGTVRIDLLRNGVPEMQIASATANDGSYLWNVPLSALEAEDYRIRITSNLDGSYVDESNGSFATTAAAVDEGICFSFESDLKGWVQDGTDNIDWTRNSGITNPLGFTGPSAASDGSFYLFVESSAPNNPNKTASLYRDFDFSDWQAPLITFDYHMFGFTMGTLNLEVSTDGGTTWDSPPAWSLSFEQGDVWHEATVDLAEYGGLSDVRLRFRGVTGSNHLSDMAIDRVCLADSTGVGIRFASQTFYCEEEDGSAILYVERTGGLAGEASVEVATTNGTADATDYTPTVTTLTWANGDGGLRSFTVPITNNEVAEEDETVFLTLSNTSGEAILGTNPITLIVRNDDDPNNFATWIDGHGIGGQARPGDDYDEDGISNATENYFGTDPGRPNAGLEAGRLSTDAATTFTFRHPVGDGLASDLAVHYRWSSNLASGFHDDGAEVGNTRVDFNVGSPVEGEVTVVATITGTVPDRMFVTVEVVEANP